VAAAWEGEHPSSPSPVPDSLAAWSEDGS
jgi:hypothetical protein